MGMGHEVYAQETTNKPEPRQNQRTESTFGWTLDWWLVADSQRGHSTASSRPPGIRDQEELEQANENGAPVWPVVMLFLNWAPIH